MVRNYIRKTNRASWSEESMTKAITAVKETKMLIRKAAQSFGVPKDSLHRRVTNQLKTLPIDKPGIKLLGAYRKVLTDPQEKELCQYILDMDSVFYGLSIRDLQNVVYCYCEKSNIKHPFNKEKKLAGRDFVDGFLKRHKDLSIRKPEGVSLNRVFGLNKLAVMRYFNNLQKLLHEVGFAPQNIYNCDESGLTCVHKPNKVIAKKGKRVVASVTSGERGQTTTIVVAMNAVGGYVPPMMVFKRKRMKPSLIDHAPPGTLGSCSDNGWINHEAFMEYIKHFVKHTHFSPTNKILLILDGHKSHTKNIDLLTFARENGLHLLSLPPHTSHKLQPLDRSVFKGLKVAFNTACCEWLRNHPARRITVDELGELFQTAYFNGATIENAVAGFRTSGIHPFNSDILPESDYLKDPRESEGAPAAEVVMPSNEAVVPATSVDTSTPVTKPVTLVAEVNNVLPTNETNPSTSSSVSTSSVYVEATEQATETSIDLSIISNTEVSFTEILPVPKLQVKKSKRKGEQSEILTSSPYKKALEEKKNKEEETKQAKILLASAKQTKAKKVSVGKVSKSSKVAKSSKIAKSSKCGKQFKVVQKETPVREKKYLIRSIESVKGKTCNKTNTTNKCDDWMCEVCGGRWSCAVSGENWVVCSKCTVWCHEECCTLNPYISSYTCDICIQG